VSFTLANLGDVSTIPAILDGVAETRWLTDAEQRAWRGYISMQARLTAQLGKQLQADSDLSHADFAVLVQLTDVPEERVRVFELAKALEWEKSRLSHHVARMQKRGLVAREECPSDARGAFIVLTPEGRTAIDNAAPTHVETVRRLVFDVLTPEQVEALAAISEQVLARLAEEDG
jgi:DNA-binding MarR family transcriptional regulator